jgi:hypothetical protein
LLNTTLVCAYLVLKGNDAACCQPAPFCEYHTSFKSPETPVPAMIQTSLLNTTLVCADLAAKGALVMASVHVIPDTGVFVAAGAGDEGLLFFFEHAGIRIIADNMITKIITENFFIKFPPCLKIAFCRPAAVLIREFLILYIRTTG